MAYRGVVLVMNDISPGPGHNRGPLLEIDPNRLREDLAADNAKLIDRADEIFRAADRVPEITDEDLARRATDFIRQVQTAIAATEAARTVAKEPYLAGGRIVDGYFRELTDALTTIKRKALEKLTQYQRRKEEEIRKEREERARVAREEEAERLREAEEAAAKIRDEKTLSDAVVAEQRATTATSDVKVAERQADARASELSRTRGEYGGVSSLRTEWDFSDVDRDTIDLEALRQHIPRDGIDRAIRSFIRAGGRELRGADIFETKNTVVR